jgi:hypothetical protein
MKELTELLTLLRKFSEEEQENMYWFLRGMLFAQQLTKEAVK